MMPEHLLIVLHGIETVSDREAPGRVTLLIVLHGIETSLSSGIILQYTDF